MGTITGQSGRVEMTTAVATGSTIVLLAARLLSHSWLIAGIAAGGTAASMTASNRRMMALARAPRH